jgi:hypothetical protein
MAASLVVAVAIGSSARAALGPPPEPAASERRSAGIHGHPIGHTTGGDHLHTASAGTDPLAGSELDVHQGEAAVAELIEADILEEVAAGVGLAPEALVEEFLADPSLFLGADGVVGYADAFALDGTGTSSDALTAVPPGVDVLTLNSRPGADRTLHLDFAGHTTADNANWTSVGAPNPIESLAFTGSDATIYEVWQRVSEDFAPFDINVTTADPGLEAIRRASATDQVFGQRVVITPSNWTNQNGVLGVALLNSFGTNGDTPAFVFTGNNPPVKVIAEAVSHEAGHTFGLRHDGTCGASPAEYYDGHGVWAPIMGRSISTRTPVTQWARGEYAWANNLEDDIGRIRSLTGLARDDHGNTAAAATRIALGTTTTGLIGIGDVDYFAVDVPAGTPLSVSLRSVASWGNLYASVTLRNQAGTVIRTGVPSAPPMWSAPIAVGSLPAGRYTIEVRPTSHLTAVDGFTTYGSLGWYVLSVSATAGPPDPPVGPASAFAQASRLSLRPTC